MKFHEWTTMYQCNAVNSKLSVPEVYREAIKQIQLSDKDPRWIVSGLALLESESLWYKASRPYYKAYPAIVAALCKLNLNLRLADIEYSPRPILIRMPIGSEPSFNGAFIKSCLVLAAKKYVSMAAEWIDSNGVSRGSAPHVLFTGVTRTIDEILSPDGLELMDSRYDKNETLQCIKLSWRIALTCLLLADDPSIITPDVLAKDRDRYNSETDEAWKQRAVDRARRRGIVGWSIGADYEVCPHYRRPHFGLRHTGKGKTVPRIVPIKGAVVHRSRLTEVPTGYILPDGTEVEQGKVVSQSQMGTA